MRRTAVGLLLAGVLVACGGGDDEAEQHADEVARAIWADLDAGRRAEVCAALDNDEDALKADVRRRAEGVDVDGRSIVEGVSIDQLVEAVLEVYRAECFISGG